MKETRKIAEPFILGNYKYYYYERLYINKDGEKTWRKFTVKKKLIHRTESAER